MATKSTVNTFKKLDTDTSQNKQDNSSFYDGENLRLISDEALSNGALVNFRGTKAKINLGDKSVALKGYTEVGNDLALLLHKEYTTPELEDTITRSNVTVDNFSLTSESFSPKSNNSSILTNSNTTVVGPTLATLNKGEVLSYYTESMTNPVLVIQAGYEYALTFMQQTSFSSYYNKPYSVIIGNANCLSGGFGKSILTKTDVFYKKDFVSSAQSDCIVNFTVPSGTEDLYVIFYSSDFVDNGTTYSLNDTSNTYLQLTNVQLIAAVNADKSAISVDDFPIDWETYNNFEPLILSTQIFDSNETYTKVVVKIDLDNVEGDYLRLGLVEVDPNDVPLNPIYPVSAITLADDTIFGPNANPLDEGDYTYILGTSASGIAHAEFTFLSTDISAILTPNKVKFAFFNDDTIPASSGAINSAVVSINGFPYNVESMEAYSDVDMLETSYNVSFGASTYKNYQAVTVSNFTKGFNYLFNIIATGANGSFSIATVYDPTPDYSLNNGVNYSSLIVDLKNRTESGNFTIYLFAGYNETITYSIGSISKIYDLVEITTITTNSPQVITFNVANTDSNTIVTSTPVYVYNPTTFEIVKTVQVNPTTGLKYYLPISGYNGYKIGINPSGNIIRANTVSITNFNKHLIVNDETLVYTLPTNNRLYNFSATFQGDNTYATPNTNIVFTLKNTTTNEVIQQATYKISTTTGYIPVNMDFFIEDTTDVYKIYVTTYDSVEVISKVIIGSISFDVSTIELGGSMIAKVTPTDDDVINNVTVIYSDSLSTEKLGFNTVDYIEVVSKIQNSSIHNIYFTVPGYPIRSFNIVDNSLKTYSASYLDILPDFKNVTIEVSNIISGGQIPTGRRQYTYKLLRKYGQETSFGPISDLISYTTSDLESKEFVGSDIDTNSNKSAVLTISNLDYSFYNIIKIYSVHYTDNNTPSINLIGEKPFSTSTIKFTDTGSVLDTVTLEDFNAFGSSLISAKTLASKNNILFAGDISELSDDILPLDLDCRAYRFKNVSGTITSNIYQADAITNPSYYTITNNGAWTYYVHNGTSYQSSATGSNWSIPLDADCINYYNDEFKKDEFSNVEPYNFKFKSDGTTIGGTGKIVSYEIKVDDAYTQLVEDGQPIVDNNNLMYLLKNTSFKQGETYRIGLVAFDIKGKPYFNNWVGDIRMPYLTGTDSIFKSVLDGTEGDASSNVKMYSKNIYLQVTVNTDNISTDVLAKISGFQVTMVERTLENSTIMAQGSSLGGSIYGAGNANGLCSGFYTHSQPRDKTVTDSFDAIEPYYNRVLPFHSPEYYANSGQNIDNANYRLKLINIYAHPVKEFIKTNIFPDVHIFVNNFITDKLSAKSATQVIYPLTGVTSSVNQYNMSEVSLRSNTVVGYGSNVSKTIKLDSYIENGVQSGHQFLINSVNYRVYARTVSDSANVSTGNSSDHTMYTAKSLMLLLNSASFDVVPNSSDTTYTKDAYMLVFDLYKDNADSIYGGITYENRKYNTYVPISKVLNNDSNSIVLNGFGDSYNRVWQELSCIVDPSLDDLDSGNLYNAGIDRRQNIYMLPLESRINTTLFANKPITYMYDYPSGTNLESSKIGLVDLPTKGIELYGDKYDTSLDFLKYNNVYSIDNSYPNFVIRPDNFESISERQYTVVASEQDNSGSYTDNWTKFLYANLIDVDPLYGSINKLSSINNKLYFFQDNAIGILAVKDRYVLNENVGASQLALGTGGILERYDYLRFQSGTLKPNHVINTVNGLYYIDTNRKVLDVIRESGISLSIDKGINSLFRSLYTSSSNKVTIGFDPIYREVLFSIDNGTTKSVLVFSELISEFGPKHTAVPDLYINMSDKLLSFKHTNLNSTEQDSFIYKHNAGSFGEVYTEADIDGFSGIHSSSISFIVNPNSVVTNIFDNIEFSTEVLTPNTSIFDDDVYIYETVDSIDFKNSYQKGTTNVVVKDGVNSRPNTSRRFRNWTTQVPLTDKDSVGYGNRFVDKFISLTFKYNNSSGNKLFKLHDVITYFRQYHK